MTLRIIKICMEISYRPTAPTTVVWSWLRSSLHSPGQFGSDAMLMRNDKAKTAFYGCHCTGEPPAEQPHPQGLWVGPSKMAVTPTILVRPTQRPWGRGCRQSCVFGGSFSFCMSVYRHRLTIYRNSQAFRLPLCRTNIKQFLFSTKDLNFTTLSILISSIGPLQLPLRKHSRHLFVIVISCNFILSYTFASDYSCI